MPAIATRLAEIKTAIAETLKERGREGDDICLLAVSKSFSAAQIEEALQAGQRVFAENRLQEMQEKYPPLIEQWEGVALHFIGAVQSKKAAPIVALCDAIHSLDRPSLARALADAIQKHARHPQIFVQVNSGAEVQKSGVPPRDVPDFVALCQKEYGLTISGLMCLPPADENPALHFALVEKYARELGLPALSMGMSGDWPTALAFGATHIRLGTAIFGARA